MELPGGIEGWVIGLDGFEGRAGLDGSTGF